MTAPAETPAAAAAVTVGRGDGPPSPDRREGTVLLAIMLVAAAVSRLYLLLATDFPINDGGPFVAIIDQTAAIFPALPPQFGWNGLEIPFAYPPLAFWLAALLKTAGINAIATMHVLPIVMNIAFVGLFALLLDRSRHSRVFTAIAVLFLSISLRSFEWLVMGGGLTRGLGSLFLMLALLTVARSDRDGAVAPSPRRMAFAGAAVAGAILSHLEWGLLAACALVVSRALSSRSAGEFAVTTTIAGLSAVVLVAPWLLWLLATNGIGPLIAAGGTSGWDVGKSSYMLVRLGLGVSLVNPFILLGGIALLWRRQFFWIAFMLLCLFVTPRHGQTPLSLAYAVFAAQGVATLCALLVRLMRQRTAALAIATLAVAAFGARQAYASFRGAETVRPLSGEVRHAMGWVAANHPGARIAVFTGRFWAVDSSAEWFATVAKAQSVTTVQGREWLPDGAFDRSVELGERLRQSKTCPELLGNLQFYPRFEFVWAESMRQCFASPAFYRVYSNPQVGIFRLRR